MNKLLPEKNMPRINFLIIFFLLTILKNYKVPSAYDYFLVFVIFVALILNVFPIIKYKNKGFEVNRLSLFIWGITFAFLTISTFVYDQKKSFIFAFTPFFLTSLYVYIMIMKFGEKFKKQFLTQFMIVMNIFSILNLYQVVFHKPFLLGLLADKFYMYQYSAIGTSSFRTISVFGHPILFGLFLIFAFVCNLFLLKSGMWKYLLQVIVVLNIYSTGSRSSWIAFSLVLMLLLVLKLFSFKKINVKITRKNILSMYLSFCIILTGIGFLIINISTIANTIMTRFGDSLSNNSTDISNLQRTGAIELIMHNISESSLLHQLFGNGMFSVSNFMLNHPIIIKNFASTDNQYLTWLYEYGILGLLLMIIWIISLLLTNIVKHPTTKYNKICFYLLIVVSLELYFFEGIGAAWTDLSILIGFSVAVLSIKQKEIKSDAL
ncbi:O-antigen ligase family protein [Niallia sp. 03190]|uniref:O-antigen ligase family protein n=1 Tax=Niallia sp. 03190 TaxID=3458061 RepID=UPI004043ACD1